MQLKSTSSFTRAQAFIARPMASDSEPLKKRKRATSVSPETTELLSTPWLDMMTPEHRNGENLEKKLHHEILAYSRYMRPTRQETTIREKVFSMVENVAKRRFNDGVVKLFGSAAFGLTLPMSDIDIVVSTETLKQREEYKISMFQLVGMLKRAGPTEYVEVRHRARTPILSFETTAQLGAYKVDIGINNTDGLEAIPLVQTHMSEMPALGPLVMVIKGLLAQHHMNDAAMGGLSSYAIILMVASFLQLNPTERSRTDIDDPMGEESLGHLLIDFLLYYGSRFPYTASYISVTEGKILPKRDASWIRPSKPLSLAIQCLVKPDNDVGKSAHRLEDICREFRRANAQLLSCDVEDETILGSVVGVERSTLERRASIVRLARAELNPRPATSPAPKVFDDFRRPLPRNGALAKGDGSAQSRSIHPRPLMERLSQPPEPAFSRYDYVSSQSLQSSNQPSHWRGDASKRRRQ